jgi:hypothetical protein
LKFEFKKVKKAPINQFWIAYLRLFCEFCEAFTDDEAVAAAGCGDLLTNDRERDELNDETIVGSKLALESAVNEDEAAETPPFAGLLAKNEFAAELV